MRKLKILTERKEGRKVKCPSALKIHRSLNKIPLNKLSDDRNVSVTARGHPKTRRKSFTIDECLVSINNKWQVIKNPFDTAFGRIFIYKEEDA